MFDEQYKKLNPEQRQAVDHVDGPMLVLAGAGTGKTQIIALRIAKLLQTTQLEPHNILCLTFTETGAAAMRQRLVDIIGTAAYYVTIGTFHSFCNEVIQTHPEQFLFTHDLQPLIDIEQVRVMQEVLDKLPVASPLKPFAAPYFYLQPLLRLIQTLKRENITVERYEQIIIQEEQFFNEHQTQLEEFLEIPTRSLKLEVCTALHEQLDHVEVSQLYQRYCTGDEPSSTKFKQALKRYLEKVRMQQPKQRAVIEAYTLYQAQLKQHGWYDYEDMLLFVVKAFETNPDLLADYQERFQYILVDEYQDTNGAQNRIVELLGSFFTDPNIFAVGDDRQSIYRFQGASLENILFFMERYRDAKLISLRQNYRSQQTILDAAKAVIDHNQHSLQRSYPDIVQTLVAAKPLSPQPVYLGKFATAQTEHYWIAKQIQHLIKTSTNPAEIAIIYRNNRDADNLMDVLEYFQIPFHLVAGVDIMNDIYVQQLLTLLRYIATPQPDETLFTILHFAFLKFQPLDIIKMLSVKEHRLNEMLFNVDWLQQAGVEQLETLKKFGDNLLRWRQSSVNTKFVRFFEEVLHESGLLDYVLQLPDKIEHLNRINTLLDEMKRLQRAEPDITLRAVLENIELFRDNNITLEEAPLQTTPQAVRLLTAHKAKGLEFEQVFIMHAIDKHWGNVPQRAVLSLPSGILHNDLAADPTHNEDERRLFYVAMTRAKQGLYITSYAANGSGRAQVPALFVSELASAQVEHIDTTAIETEALERLQTILLQTPALSHTDAERAYLKAKLATYSLSPSHLNDYLTCPKLFYYQDVLRVPQPTERAVGYGTAVHSALEATVGEYLRTKQLPAVEFLLEKFEHYLKRQTLSSKDTEDSLRFGRAELSSYYTQHTERLAQLAMVENKFVAEIDGVPINGKIDKIELRGEHQEYAHVIDYKTGNPDNKSAKLAKGGDYHRQLLFYKLLCDRSAQFKRTVRSGEIHFIQQSKKTKTYPHKQYDLTDTDITELVNTIKQVYSDIQALKFLDVRTEDCCGECKYCEMF